MRNDPNNYYARRVGQFAIKLVRHISDPDVWSMEIVYHPRLTRTAATIIPLVSTHCAGLEDAQNYAQTALMTLLADLSLHSNAALKEITSG